MLLAGAVAAPAAAASNDAVSEDVDFLHQRHLLCSINEPDTHGMPRSC